jgi:hypothetical protein
MAEGTANGLPHERRRARRAPRLSPRDRIAPYMTRGGRFAKIDPLQTRQRPTLPRVLGFIGWAVLLGESLRRARKLVMGDAEPQ